MNMSDLSVMQQGPLFKSVYGALMFAYNFSAEQYDPPAMLKMIGTHMSSGKGLKGVDGAGQAGMILQEVKKIPIDQQHFLCARYALPTMPCSCGRPCCSKETPNRAWRESVDWLSDYTLRRALAGTVSHYRMRSELVRRALAHFEPRVEKLTLTRIAEMCDVPRKTVGKHNEAVLSFITGIGKQAELSIYDRLKLAALIE